MKVGYVIGGSLLLLAICAVIGPWTLVALALFGQLSFVLGWFVRGLS